MDPPTPRANDRLRVYVRVKPLDGDQKSIIDIVDDESIVFDPIDAENEPSYEYTIHGKTFKSIGARKNKHSSYTFDRVFDDHSTNYKIYETVTRPMVDATINGLNCSVFAYGTTGSGKTYTMLGNHSCPGVIYHTSKDLFDRLLTMSNTDPLPPELKICYFEIYNEKIRDLLVWEPNNFIRCGNKRLRTTPERCRARQTHDSHNLNVCEGSKDGASFVIPDLSYHCPNNAEQLIHLLEAGNRNRSQHPTDANADSSRSHAIFQILLTRRINSNRGAEYELQQSKMSLIDLAGSERASVAYRAGNDRSKNLQMEGGNINKSLLALSSVITALAGRHKFIPYRNSKLTRLLKDSLGGKCRTAMIATLCQQTNHYDDTQNTLIYAARAKCIKLQPGRNFTGVAVQPRNYKIIIDNQNMQINNYKIQLEELKNEIAMLRAQNIRSPNNLTYIANDRGCFLDSSSHKQRLEALYEQRREIRMEILKYESKFKKNELKLVFKRFDEDKQQTLNGEVPRMNGNSTFLLTSGSNNANLYSENSQALKTQLEYFETERKTLLEKARINELHIHELTTCMATEFEMKSYGGPEDFDRELLPYMQEKELSQELEEKIFSEQHAYDIAQEAMNRLMVTEGFLLEAANVIKYTHGLVKVRGLSDTLETRMTQLLKKLDGKKNVVWKDDKYATENDSNDKPLSALSSVHDYFSLNFLTPFKNNNTLLSRRLSKNLVSSTTYTPEQSNTTFDASH